MTGPGGHPCCETLASLGPEDWIGGHHRTCPRFGLAAIEARDGGRAFDTADLARADRATLLAVLDEERARHAAREAEWQEAERVAVDAARRREPIHTFWQVTDEERDQVEALLGERPPACHDCGRRPVILDVVPRSTCERCRPKGDLASIPVDSCDGADR